MKTSKLPRAFAALLIAGFLAAALLAPSSAIKPHGVFVAPSSNPFAVKPAKAPEYPRTLTGPRAVPFNVRQIGKHMVFDVTTTTLCSLTTNAIGFWLLNIGTDSFSSTGPHVGYDVVLLSTHLVEITVPDGLYSPGTTGFVSYVTSNVGGCTSGGLPGQTTEQNSFVVPGSSSSSSSSPSPSPSSGSPVSSFGSSEGSSFGSSEGSSFGSSFGSSVGPGPGSSIAPGSSFGSSLGSSRGSSTGSSLASSTGSSLASSEGSSFGSSLASSEGSSLGSSTGSSFGSSEGSSEGSSYGSSLGSCTPCRWWQPCGLMWFESSASAQRLVQTLMTRDENGVLVTMVQPMGPWQPIPSEASAIPASSVSCQPNSGWWTPCGLPYMAGSSLVQTQRNREGAARVVAYSG